MPVRLCEDQHQDVPDDRQGQTHLDAVLGREGLGGKGQDALRRIDGQDEAKADDELQDHGDADDVQGVVAESLEYGNHDGDHGGSNGRSTGKAEMDDNEEQCENRKDQEDAHACQAKDGHELVGQPGRGLGRKQGRAHADADTEEDQGTPGDA